MWNVERVSQCVSLQPWSKHRRRGSLCPPRVEEPEKVNCDGLESRRLWDWVYQTIVIVSGTHSWGEHGMRLDFGGEDGFFLLDWVQTPPHPLPTKPTQLIQMCVWVRQVIEPPWMVSCRTALVAFWDQQVVLAWNVNICLSSTILEMSPTAASGQWGRKLLPVEDTRTAWTLLLDTVNLIYISQMGSIHQGRCWFGRQSCVWWQILSWSSYRGNPLVGQSVTPGTPKSVAPEPAGRSNRSWRSRFHLSLISAIGVAQNNPLRPPSSSSTSSSSPLSLTSLRPHSFHPKLASIDLCALALEVWKPIDPWAGLERRRITWRAAGFTCIISHIYKVFKWSDSRARTVDLTHFQAVSEHHSVSKVCVLLLNI